MIIGKVNSNREAVIPVVIVNERKQTKLVNAVVDTGYTGDLTLPKDVVETLELSLRGFQEATLGNGSIIEFETYAGSVIWNGKVVEVEINASEAGSLIGMKLLEGFKLEVEGRPDGQVRISALAF